MATLESILRVFSNFSNRDNKLRARMKWLVDTMGFEEMQERIFKERKMLVASSSWPGGIPEAVRKSGDAPAGLGQGAVPTARSDERRVGKEGVRTCRSRWAPEP